MLYSTKDYVNGDTSFLNILFNKNKIVKGDHWPPFNIFNYSKKVNKQETIFGNVFNYAKETEEQSTCFLGNAFNIADVVEKQGTCVGVNIGNIATKVENQYTLIGLNAFNYARKVKSQGPIIGITLCNYAVDANEQLLGVLNIAKNAKDQTGFLNISKQSEKQYGIFNLCASGNVMQYGLINVCKDGIGIFKGEGNKKERAKERVYEWCLPLNPAENKFGCDVAIDLVKSRPSLSYRILRKKTLKDYMRETAQAEIDHNHDPMFKPFQTEQMHKPYKVSHTDISTIPQ